MLAYYLFRPSAAWKVWFTTGDRSSAYAYRVCLQADVYSVVLFFSQHMPLHAAVLRVLEVFLPRRLFLHYMRFPSISPKQYKSCTPAIKKKKKKGKKRALT